MAHGGKRGPDQSWRCKYSNELTVYDFAHSARPAGSDRLKKGASTSVSKEVKRLGGASGTQRMMAEEEEVDWFDKDLDEFDIPIPGPEEEEQPAVSPEPEVDLPQEEYSLNNRSRRRRRHKRRQQEAERRTGMVYPEDLWFLLGDYIEPGAVVKFAILCKGANMVTRTLQFWRNLYKRYFDKEKKLPEDLNPHAMERNHGLRARCVRALYILDPSLAQHVQPKGPFDTDPHLLVGYRCMLVWHQPSEGKWKFCFKMVKPSLQTPKKNTQLAFPEDVRNGYNNLFYNPEEHCCVLQLISTHFAATSPQVMGQLLSAVHMSLSHDFRHQRLKLSFDSTRVMGSASAVHASECLLDPVISVRIFHWWDPKYPFPT